jgi:hypothetical protein
LDEISEENSTLSTTVDYLKNKLDQLEKHQLRMAELLENLSGNEKRPILKPGNINQSLANTSLN